MRAYTSQDSFNVKGRGLIFVISIPAENDVPVIDEQITIDNSIYRVLGVERAVKLMYPTVPSDNVNVIVEQLKDTP